MGTRSFITKMQITAKIIEIQECPSCSEKSRTVTSKTKLDSEGIEF